MNNWLGQQITWLIQCFSSQFLSETKVPFTIKELQDETKSLNNDEQILTGALQISYKAPIRTTKVTPSPVLYVSKLMKGQRFLTL